MELPPTLSAEMAITRQNVALSMIKSAAQADRQIAAILDNAVRNVSASSLGTNVNITA